ncbi:MAG: hypothetical protein QM733_17300 [Ilumatobacteraceae bacterium]
MSAAIGAVLGVVIVGAVGAVSASSTVDTVRRRRLRWFPWELIVVGAAVASFLRLERSGGVRLVGERATGGDLLAQAFALAAVLAVIAVASRPMVWLARRSRQWGRRLPLPVVTGLRRVGAEPVVSVVVATATALAIGAFTIATAMTASAQQLLADKAAVFVGSDEAVSVAAGTTAVPGGLRGTVVRQVDVRDSNGGRVTVLGVDPATFATAVRWRADAADVTLEVLLAELARSSPDEVIPAIVVGSADPTTLTTLTGQSFAVDRVASVRWFPGEHNGSTLVVVDRGRLVDKGRFGSEGGVGVI